MQSPQNPIENLFKEKSIERLADKADAAHFFSINQDYSQSLCDAIMELRDAIDWEDYPKKLTEKEDRRVKEILKILEKIRTEYKKEKKRQSKEKSNSYLKKRESHAQTEKSEHLQVAESIKEETDKVVYNDKFKQTSTNIGKADNDNKDSTQEAKRISKEDHSENILDKKMSKDELDKHSLVKSPHKEDKRNIPYEERSKKELNSDEAERMDAPTFFNDINLGGHINNNLNNSTDKTDAATKSFPSSKNDNPTKERGPNEKENTIIRKLRNESHKNVSIEVNKVSLIPEDNVIRTNGQENAYITKKSEEIQMEKTAFFEIHQKATDKNEKEITIAETVSKKKELLPTKEIISLGEEEINTDIMPKVSSNSKDESQYKIENSGNNENDSNKLPVNVIKEVKDFEDQDRVNCDTTSNEEEEFEEVEDDEEIEDENLKRNAKFLNKLYTLKKSKRAVKLEKYIQERLKKEIAKRTLPVQLIVNRIDNRDNELKINLFKN